MQNITPTLYLAYLQFSLIKIQQPLQGHHVIEAIQERLRLFFNASREVPLHHQAVKYTTTQDELKRIVAAGYSVNKML
jgi:hypothetical protein